MRRAERGRRRWRSVKPCTVATKGYNKGGSKGLLKRFTSRVQRSGVLRDAKRKRTFISKGQAAREKQQRAARRCLRKE